MGKGESNERFLNINELVFPHIYRVNASAGSGKTNALSERFIKLLLLKKLDNNSIENIIAITFTNKAVMEMKERILHKLKTLYFQDKSDEKNAEFISKISEEMNIAEGDLKKIVEPKIDTIISDYAHFQVKTIDSMISYLSKISARDMGIPPDFELNFDEKEPLEYALNSIVSEVEKNKDVFRKVMDYVNFDISVKGKYIWQPVKRIEEGLKNYIVLMHTNEIKNRSVVSEPRLDEMKGEIRSVVERIENLANEKGIRLKRRSALDKYKRGKFEGIKIENADSIINKNDKEYVFLFEDHIERLNNLICRYVETIAELDVARYVAFLEDVKENTDDFIRRKGVVSLGHLTNLLKNVLREGYVPEIFYKLGNTYYHYMIDEFQDTSRVQWEIVESLVENVVAENGSLFYVGDVKQAIYRYRGGDTSLFTEIYDKNKNKTKCYETTLASNYRSAVEIVEFNNRCFGEEHLKDFLGDKSFSGNKINVGMILDNYRNITQKPYHANKHGYVSVERSGDTEEIFEEKIPETIKVVLDKGYDKKDICILVRTNKDGENIAKILMEKGYDVIFSKIAKVNENRYVNEIVSFLKFLNNPTDKLSFFSFVFGNIFLRKTGISAEDVYQFAFSHRDDAAVYKSFKQKFPKICDEEIEPFMRYVNYLPYYDIVVEIIKHFNVIENFDGAEAYIMKFLEIIKDMSDRGELSIEEITEQWEGDEDEEGKNDKFDVTIPEYIDAIRIMTIHKAKGLAFPVVIIPPGILKKSGRSNKNIYYEETEKGINLLRINEKLTSFSERLSKIYYEEKTRKFIDRLNLLYVAMTRAEDIMFIFVPEIEKKKSEEAIFFFPDDDEEIHIGELPSKTKKSNPVKSEENIKNSYPHTDVRWHKNLVFHGEDTIFDSNRREAISRGELFHKMLEDIETFDIDSVVKLSNRLSKKYGFEKENVKNLLEFLIKDDVLSGMYSGDIRVFNEKEIVTGEDDTYRVDRLVFKRDKIYVIDYKTGENYNEKHRAQIKRYMKILNDIYRKECTGILIYVDERKKVIVNG